ncbi:hypothetical protein OIE67_25670 [Nonomuraea fuscirosea]|uniref:hypothetical protein n=1 Tax=Nonomuraea fuscirosea TaxID=1291556 RepID=UPI002DDB719C|nr:hypothetical protein [Nonomuraea fuscirosea]WSA57885.1 hypothetical protein OIE67_25670 [Nonomuraea fuscirosea]
MTNPSPAPLAAADDFLYSWSAQDTTRGSGGITEEPEQARQCVREALARLSPDAGGVVERVRLDRSARQPSYIHVAVVWRFGRRSAEREGGVVAC